MLTRLTLLLTALLSSYAAFSQASAFSVALSTGIERTVYWDEICPHADMGFTYSFGEHLNVQGGLGFVRKSAGDVTPYAIKQKIQNVEPNLHVLYSLQGRGRRLDAKIGAGLRQMFTQVDYTPIVFVKNDQVTKADRVKYKVNTPALDLVLEADYPVFKRFFVGLHLGYNIYLDKKRLLPIAIQSIETGGSFISTIGITSYPLDLLHGLVRLGYYF